MVNIVNFKKRVEFAINSLNLAKEEVLALKEFIHDLNSYEIHMTHLKDNKETIAYFNEQLIAQQQVFEKYYGVKSRLI